jgi:hypothetical protein
MQAVAKSARNDFHPVTLTLTFESQDEINSFYAILNHSSVIEPTNFETPARVIRRHLMNECPSIDYTKAHQAINTRLR